PPPWTRAERARRAPLPPDRSVGTPSGVPLLEHDRRPEGGCLSSQWQSPIQRMPQPGVQHVEKYSVAIVRHSRTQSRSPLDELRPSGFEEVGEIERAAQLVQIRAADRVISNGRNNARVDQPLQPARRGRSVQYLAWEVLLGFRQILAELLRRRVAQGVVQHTRRAPADDLDLRQP